MFNQEDQSVFKNGLFCDDVFGSYPFLIEEINDSDEFRNWFCKSSNES